MPQLLKIIQLFTVRFHQYNIKVKAFQLFAWVRTNKLKSLLYLSLAGLGAVLFLALLIYIGVFGRLPTQGQLKNIKSPIASIIYGSNNQVLDYYYVQNRSTIDSTEIAQHFLDALVATEDVRFYEHKGIDYRSLGRVLVKSILLQQKRSGGGSTITQQLAKNLYGRQKLFFLSSPVNKMREMMIARRMEKVYTKKEILILYLNTVSFGENLYGIEKAAHRFFNKKPGQLSLSEAAVLVGVLKAPGYYNPRSNPEKSLIRRNTVLSQMHKYGYLTPEEYQKYQLEPIKLDYQLIKISQDFTGYYKAMIREEFDKWAAKHTKEDGSPYDLDLDGLKIYTTIHPSIQRSVEKALKSHISRLQPVFRNDNWDVTTTYSTRDSFLMMSLAHQAKFNLSASDKESQSFLEQISTPRTQEFYSIESPISGEFSSMDSLAHFLTALHGGVIAIDPKNGSIAAYAGGADFGFSQYDQVSIRRQVGSTFKPIAYLAGLESGLTPCEYFDNELRTYGQYEGWRPRNAAGNYGGSYSMHGALAESINTVSVQVILKAGVKRVLALAKALGITASLPSVPSIVLGTADISLKEMVTAYAVIANGGQQVSPFVIRKIVDEQGKTVFNFGGARGGSIASPENIELIQKMMRGVVTHGSGVTMKYYVHDYNVIGKTGTTQDQSDGWFIGALPDICVGAWIGTMDKRIHFKSLRLGSGASTALPIVGRVFGDLAMWKTPIIHNFSFENADFPCPIRSDLPAEEMINYLNDSNYIDSGHLYSEDLLDSLALPISIPIDSITIGETMDTLNRIR